jgi:hypothetical protein
MKLRLATIAATAALAIAGTTLATTASARDCLVPIGAPGFAVGYSNYGYGRVHGYAAPVAWRRRSRITEPRTIRLPGRTVHASCTRGRTYHRPYWRAHYGWR